MIPGVRLRNDVDMPSIGLGTWKITDKEIMNNVIGSAYDMGYRLIDTASAYSNEIAISKAIRTLGIPRENLFLTDKVWNTDRGYDQVQEALRRSLKKLKTDYIDLYLIHWPASKKLYPDDWKDINAQTWKGMEKLLSDGLVRAIGVCNFKVEHLEELSKTCEVLPFVDQIECHPGMISSEIRDYCSDNGIIVEASSPLGNGKILNNDTILEISERYGKTSAQICLMWCRSKGIIPIPKTTSANRLKENIDIFDKELIEQDVKLIDEIPFCGGLGIDPDEVTEFG